MNEITQATKDLINKYAHWQISTKPREGETTIHVDEVASKVAAFYEQIRTIVDWQEEHLMRRGAIIRKLKRKFLEFELNNFVTEGVAEPLVLELIRGGFFPNDKLPESKIGDVQRIIDKYVFILKYNPDNRKSKGSLQSYTKLLEIAACEIEETLAPSLKEMALIEYMFSQMQVRIKVNEDIFKKELLKKEEIDIQIYIGVQQALFKLDEPIISYNLLKYTYPYWDNPSEDELLKISQNIFGMLSTIEAQLNHPLANKFYGICEKYDTPYLLLGDILVKEGAEKINIQIYDPASLENTIKVVYAKRLTNLKEKIKRTAVYSTASIFITKILALVIWKGALTFLPALAFLPGSNFHAAFLAADILVPTMLMAFLVATVRPPSKRNLSLVIMETMRIVYQKEKNDVYEIKLSRKRGVATRALLSFIYLLGACISFGLIFWAFWYLQFPIFSIVINILFIALILFAGTAIRARSRELSIEDENEGFFGFVSDILFLPLTGVGKWLSNTWKQYNVIITFLNALVDMPFSAFVEFLERWRYFIKDKKEEMR